MIHELKILPEYFKSVLSGEKSFEIRKNDRPFTKGDLLALNEYDPSDKVYTGASCLVYIDYILDNADYCKNGYVVMSIKPCYVHKATSPRNEWKLETDYSVPLATQGAMIARKHCGNCANQRKETNQFSEECGKCVSARLENGETTDPSHWREKPQTTQTASGR